MIKVTTISVTIVSYRHSDVNHMSNIRINSQSIRPYDGWVLGSVGGWHENESEIRIVRNKLEMSMTTGK